MKFHSIVTRAGRQHPAFESPFDNHEQAAKVLDISDNEFARSLVASLALCIKKGWEMSEARAYWLHKLALEKVNPTPAPTGTGDYSNIADMFARVLDGSKLKFPKVILSTKYLKEIGAKMGDDPVEVKLYVSGPRARFPGSVTVVENKSWTERGAYYGRITGGKMFAASGMTDDVRKLLDALKSDPAKVIGESGKLLGSCCFCRRELSDDRSKAAGYGKTCAGNYGLPWGAGAGKKKAAPKTRTDKQIEKGSADLKRAMGGTRRRRIAK